MAGVSVNDLAILRPFRLRVDVVAESTQNCSLQPLQTQQLTGDCDTRLHWDARRFARVGTAVALHGAGGHTHAPPEQFLRIRALLPVIPFVEQLARRVAATMPHSIDIGDLVQDGVIGLIDAAHRFDEARGIKFETFAERRIRGAMIDALRKDAWPRGVRRQRRELEAAREELRRELGHEPSLADLAAKDRVRRKAPGPHHRPHQRHRIDLAARQQRDTSTNRRCRRR